MQTSTNSNMKKDTFLTDKHLENACLKKERRVHLVRGGDNGRSCPYSLNEQSVGEEQKTPTD